MRTRLIPFTIIWDFDGTLLPSDPYDSEHTLLLSGVQAPGEKLSPPKRIVANAIIFMDRRKWMGPAFKKYYAWVLSGTPLSRIEEVSKRLARKISDADRAALRWLFNAGHPMMIVSCGTTNLIERILELAGIKSCFVRIEGNRLLSADGRITGIERRIIHPADKLKPVREQCLDSDRVIAVGDGYTDLPLLAWAGVPVLMDRSRRKGKPRTSGRYHGIASIPEIVGLIDRLSAKTGGCPSRGREK